MIEPPMTNPAGQGNRIKLMIIETALIAVVLIIFKYHWAALGLGLGAVVSIFNFLMVSRAEALNSLLKRYMLRMLTAGAVIMAAAFVNTGMIFGALAGLTMEMQTYLWDAVKELRGKS
jgi:hypothetical protein